MAIMIKVHKRDTGIKKEFRRATKMASRKLRLALGISLIMNIILGISIYYDIIRKFTN